MNLSDLKSWIQEKARSSQCEVTLIPFSQTKEWEYSPDKIKHKTNRFFKIIGIEWQHKNQLTRQLLIEQTEIGILGYLMYQKGDTTYFLVQSKIEPGNVGLAQLAPSCQATLSNIEQAHGGDKPLFVEYFTPETQASLGAEVISNSLQSEQGSKFYGKRNRNMVVKSKTKMRAPDDFVWVEARVLCQALAQDYVANTDTRSVLVSSDWQKILGGLTLFDGNDKLKAELRKSYQSSENLISTETLLETIQEKDQEVEPAKIIPVSDFELNNDDSTGFKLFHVSVKTDKREVTEWDQPIVQSSHRGEYVLYCGRAQGVLYFAFEYWAEPGLYNQVELGVWSGQSKTGKTLVSCWQSDEGGRFFRDKSKYSVVDIGEIDRFNEGQVWLSLKQVQELCLHEGIFTNEARSAISLLLSFA